MAIFTLFPISECDTVATAEEKRQRKRIQNRLNQRARRFRVREGNAPDSKTKRHPFRVHRWRLGYETSSAPYTASKLGSRHHDHRLASVEYNIEANKQHHEAESSSRATLDVPNALVASDNSLETMLLPADHLLHLIHYNIFRGVHITKEVIGPLTISIIPGVERDEIVAGYGPVPGFSMLLAASPDLPECLVPTSLQMEVEHATWINLFPFAKMRDNLISWQKCFDHAELVEDLLGLTIPADMFAAPWTSQEPIASKMTLLDGDDDEITTARKGLILWGEPHNPGSWEATPGFLRKWGWTAEGCEELIESSNRWRNIRGEEPIRLFECE